MSEAAKMNQRITGKSSRTGRQNSRKELRRAFSDRRRKRSKTTIEAEKSLNTTKSTQQQQQQLNQSNDGYGSGNSDECSSISPVSIESSSDYNSKRQLPLAKTTDGFNKQNSQMVDPFGPINGDEIYIDLDMMLAQEVDTNISPNAYKLLFPNYAGRAIKQSLLDYCRWKHKFTLGNLITQEYLKIMKLAGCFILPSKKKCLKYINSYFNTFHQLHPYLDPLQFLQDFKDLSRPPSLLMLRSMIYLGCRVLARTQEERDEAMVLYEKARLVYSAEIETNGIYLVVSILLLNIFPSRGPCSKGIEDPLDTAVRVATSFGMNKDMTNDPSLSESEKRICKRIFCSLTMRKRAFAFGFSKNFNPVLESCTVKPLVYSDLDDCGIEHQPLMFQALDHFTKGFALADEVLDLQRQSNQAALDFKPFSHLLRRADKLMDDFETTIAEPFRTNTNSSLLSLILQSSIVSLKMFVCRVKHYRFNAIYEKLVIKQQLTEEAANYLRVLDCSVDEDEWYRADRIHELADIICNDLLKFKKCLPLCQDTITNIYHCMLYSTTFLFHYDESIRKQVRRDLKRVTVVLEEISKLMGSPMLDAVHYILKEVIPDRAKLIRFTRLHFNSNSIELIAKKLKDFKDKSLLVNGFRHLQKFMPPLLNFDDDFRYAYGGYERADINIEGNNIADPIVDHGDIHDVGEDDFDLNVFFDTVTPTSTTAEAVANYFDCHLSENGRLGAGLPDPSIRQGIESNNVIETPGFVNSTSLMDMLVRGSPERFSRSRRNSLNDSVIPEGLHPPMTLDNLLLFSSTSLGEDTIDLSSINWLDLTGSEHISTSNPNTFGALINSSNFSGVEKDPRDKTSE